jgi:hypothetical protein
VVVPELAFPSLQQFLPEIFIPRHQPRRIAGPEQRRRPGMSTWRRRQLRSLLKNLPSCSSRGNEAQISWESEGKSEPRYLGCCLINRLLACRGHRASHGLWR